MAYRIVAPDPYFIVQSGESEMRVHIYTRDRLLVQLWTKSELLCHFDIALSELRSVVEGCEELLHQKQEQLTRNRTIEAVTVLIAS